MLIADIIAGVGFIMAIVGMQMIWGTGAGAKDGRFKTGRKGNQLGQASSPKAKKRGLILMVIGVFMSFYDEIFNWLGSFSI